MTTKRKYGDGCGLAHAGELIGERWALLVVRELVLGPKRFTDLRAGIPRVSPNVLGQRLRELEAAGVVRRRTLPPPAGSKVYELTEWGQELEPIALSLGAWATRSPAFPPDAPVGADSIMLAFRALFDPGRAGDADVDAMLKVEGQSFHLRLAGGAMDVTRDPVADPDVAVEASADDMGAAILGERSLDELVASGDMSLAGSRDAFEAILGSLAPPEPAPPAEAVAVA